MRFAQNQHKIGYGDESWATDSMMRNQSIQKQYHPGDNSFLDLTVCFISKYSKD